MKNRIKCEEILQREHAKLLEEYENAKLEETKYKLEIKIAYSEHLWDCWNQEGC